VNGERYEIRFQPAARRAIAERLPESVAAAVLEFCEAALALSPRQVGKPLFGPLAGCHGARRGTYRVVYRIDEQAQVVEVLDIAHRADIYHQSLLPPYALRVGQERGDELLRGEARSEGAGPDAGFQARGDRLQLAAVAQAIKKLVLDQ
jgi:mRNA interferase RelE/StbE